MKELNSTSLGSIRKRQILVPKEGSLRVNEILECLLQACISCVSKVLPCTVFYVSEISYMNFGITSMLCLKNQLHEL